MANPLFWLSLSVLLVAVSLTALFVAALPAVQELARAARSAEKLFDMLNRELPPTLEAIRLTGTEITSLSDDVSQNVQAAGRVVGQFDQGFVSLKQKAKQAQTTTRSFLAGVRAAWQTLSQPDPDLFSEGLEDFEDEEDDAEDETGFAPERAAFAPSQAVPPLNLNQPDTDSQPPLSAAAFPTDVLQSEPPDLH